MNKEEAIKVLNARPYTGEVREALETLIPELKESEEERVRKDIVGLIKFALNDGSAVSPGSHTTKEEAISWLEKQKEASKAIEAIERIDKFIDEYLANAHDMKDSNSEKEYYLGWDAALGKMSGILQDVYSGEKQKEQKPVEPSDKELQRHQAELTEFKKFATKQAKENQLHISYTRDVMWENFCSELLSFVNSRKPAEWSEEDEKVIDTIISVLGQYIDYKAVSGTGSGYATPRYSKEIAWLKSLRPSWRPSEDEECKNSK